MSLRHPVSVYECYELSFRCITSCGAHDRSVPAFLPLMRNKEGVCGCVKLLRCCSCSCATSCTTTCGAHDETMPKSLFRCERKGASEGVLSCCSCSCCCTTFCGTHKQGCAQIRVFDERVYVGKWARAGARQRARRKEAEREDGREG